MKTWLHIQDVEEDFDDSFIGAYFLNPWEVFYFFFVNSYNCDMVDLKRDVL